MITSEGQFNNTDLYQIWLKLNNLQGGKIEMINDSVLPNSPAKFPIQIDKPTFNGIRLHHFVIPFYADSWWNGLVALIFDNGDKKIPIFAKSVSIGAGVTHLCFPNYDFIGWSGNFFYFPIYMGDKPYFSINSFGPLSNQLYLIFTDNLETCIPATLGSGLAYNQYHILLEVF